MGIFVVSHKLKQIAIALLAVVPIVAATSTSAQADVYTPSNKTEITGDPVCAQLYTNYPSESYGFTMPIGDGWPDMKVYAFINEAAQPGQDEIESIHIYHSSVGYYVAGGSPYPELGLSSTLSQTLNPDDPNDLPEPDHMYSVNIPGAGSTPEYDENNPLRLEYDFMRIYLSYNITTGTGTHNCSAFWLQENWRPKP
ncbi:hypothetical protein O3S80_25310 [Streptomyces sp. Lzd4kr]|nr:hypothetical protein [Streptomyces sp. Lzd4kr]